MGVIKVVGKAFGLTTKATVLAAKASWHTAVAASTVGMWTAHVAGKTAGLAVDYAKARSILDGDAVLCPRGHRTPTTGTFQCSSCHFVWDGSCWVCPHAECGAKTPFIFCEVCGLGIRNPYRLRA